MISLKDGIRSLVRIDFKGRVHKQFRGTEATERCANEIKVLRVLEERACPNVPRLLEAMPEENYIITTSCGKPVEDSIPRKKSDSLFRELEEKFGVRHDDPEPRNITYDGAMGKFCVIDFELAEVLAMPEEHSGESSLRLQWASDSRQGRRHLTNQDSHLCLYKNSQGHAMRCEHGEALLPCHQALFAVSDGVGGNNGGEFASSLVLSYLANEIKEAKGSLTEKSFIKLLHETNSNVNLRAEQNPHAPQLAATYAGIFLQDDQIIWANAGDSRVYRLREEKLEQISNDHNFAFRSWKKGEISEMEFRMHPRKNQIFDCMGGGHSTISPEHGSEKWRPGDLYLICSDGIIDGLAETKLEWLMNKTLCSLDHSRAQNICNELLGQAVANDGTDDTTLVVFQIC